jgi:hypothetical protein
VSDHWTFDAETGERTCKCAGFHCPYAGPYEKRCPEWRCDCFIETHPDTPFDLHPEDFIVGRIEEMP